MNKQPIPFLLAAMIVLVRPALAALAALAMLLPATFVQGHTAYWTDSIDPGSWLEQANWLGGVVPDAVFIGGDVWDYPDVFLPADSVVWVDPYTDEGWDTQIAVKELNLDKTAQLAVEGVLTINGGNVVAHEANSYTTPGLIQRDVAIVNYTPVLNPSNPPTKGTLMLGSGTFTVAAHGDVGRQYLGMKGLEITESGRLTMAGPYSRIYNGDTKFQDRTPTVPGPLDLGLRIRVNHGEFNLYDRLWRPDFDPEFDASPDAAVLRNHGGLSIIDSTFAPMIVQSVNGTEYRQPLINEGTVVVTGNSVLDAGSLSPVSLQGSRLYMLGSAAQLGTTVILGAFSDGVIRGQAQIGAGCQIDLGAAKAVTVSVDESNPAAVFDQASLTVWNPGSRFVCGDLTVHDGYVSLDHSFRDATTVSRWGNWLRGDPADPNPGSFEEETGAAALSQPGYRAADAMKSHDLGAAPVTLHFNAESELAYVLTLENYGGLSSHGGRVRVTCPDPDIPGENRELANETFTGQAVSDYATAAYQTFAVSFRIPVLPSEENVTDVTIAIEAADAASGQIGPVIDDVQVHQDALYAGLPTIEVNGTLTVAADDEVGFSAVEVLHGMLTAGNIQMNGSMALLGGVVSGPAGGPVPMSVGATGYLRGYGDIYSANLSVSGEIQPNYRSGDGSDGEIVGPSPFQSFRVHGQVTMQPGSGLYVNLWERHTSMLEVLPGADGAGNGSVALAGRLSVDFHAENPPLPTEVITIVSASQITGGFTNVVNGRVLAAAWASTGTTDVMQGSFAVTVTGTEVTLSDFQVEHGPVLAHPTRAVAEATSANGAVVVFGAVATDAVGRPLTPVLSHASGSVFPIGTTAVTMSAEDEFQYITEESFDVVVKDTTAPQVTPPANVTVHAASSSGANASFGTAFATDAVGVSSISYSPASGAHFPVGTTTVTVTARDAANNAGTATFTVTVTPLSPQESWRERFFGTASNNGSAEDTYDADGDGLSNLLEWACELNPTASSNLPESATRNGGNLEYVYFRSVAAVNAGAIFTVEWSDTLPSGSWNTTGVTETILSDNGTVQQVKAIIPTGTSRQRFVHLKVLAPP